MSNGQETSLTRANKTSTSLRTTVPASIIKQFELSEGDTLKWKLDVDKSAGKMYIRVTPVIKKGD